MLPNQQTSSDWLQLAWIALLENSEAVDVTRMSAGRRLLRKSAVRVLSVRPGHAYAEVVDSNGAQVRVDIAVRAMIEADWELVAVKISERAAYLAGLLEGHLDQSLILGLVDSEVDVMPAMADLRASCSCTDWSDWCRHSVAVGLLLGESIARDPFELFRLRGKSREEVLEMVRDFRPVGATQEPDQSGPQAPEGVDAAEAWSAWDDRAGLGEVPPIVRAAMRRASIATGPAHVPVWEAELPPAAAADAFEVRLAAQDAVDRAWQMLANDSDSGLKESAIADLARRVGAVRDSHSARRLAKTLGVTPQVLQNWHEAWVLGGEVGVVAIQTGAPWSTDQARLAEGREQLVELGIAKRSIALNYDSLGLKDGVRLVLLPGGWWCKLHTRDRGVDSTLLAAPQKEITDLVDAPPGGG